MDVDSLVIKLRPVGMINPLKVFLEVNVKCKNKYF